jgi:hypothetical protein
MLAAVLRVDRLVRVGGLDELHVLLDITCADGPGVGVRCESEPPSVGAAVHADGEVVADADDPDRDGASAGAEPLAARVNAVARGGLLGRASR